jgi:hypothetical protein
MVIAFAAALRVGSRIVCLVVLASFAIFAYEQASTASSRQQNDLIGTSTGSTPPPTSKSTPKHDSTIHKAIDEVAEELTSPFSGVTAGNNNQWVVRGVGTLLALLAYGLGVGYLARLLRFRV